MKKLKSVRWSKEMAASEFGLNPRTLANRLRAAGIEAAKDGCFSTADICRAVFGDIDGEKLRLVREQADKLEIENRTSRRQLLEVPATAQTINRAINEIKASIYSLPNVARENKDRIVEACGRLWDRSFGIAPTDATDVESSATANG